MLTVVVVIHLMLVIALIGVVLLQKSEGGGLVGSTSGFMTGRGTANALSRATAVLAAGFFVTSLALSWLASYEHRPVAIINTSGPAAPAPPGP
ncbi:MAG: preprotein translocase subunit SecG, partial [Xanthobacteraceae bacterium]